ncbi:cupin domain-containing protein [Maridesulfovibrio bastinii]|uniref:cupin domain-containing protein n=1 Tax=Maridesulfovibrio bastinii TaxID=47157 RepID=UPI0004011ED8|nr:cupin domain-containing protein [Maridesulfovibrio bastinii]
MKYESINFEDKFLKFSDHWSPRVIAAMNDYQFKVVKIKGNFVWHDHKDTDEVFIVLSGKMEIEFRDGKVEINSGEMFVVKKGIEHKPFAAEECKILIIEPCGVINTGEEKSSLTAENDKWI